MRGVTAFLKSLLADRLNKSQRARLTSYVVMYLMKFQIKEPYDTGLASWSLSSGHFFNT